MPLAWPGSGVLRSSTRSVAGVEAVGGMAGRRDPLVCLDLLDDRVRLVRIDGDRRQAGQAEDDGAVGAVADAGIGERAVQAGAEAVDLAPAGRGQSPPAISARKRAAAVIGPIVWELDGPMPILNRSNTDRNTSASKLR